MLEIIYGTTNPAKLKSMKECLSIENLHITGLESLDIEFPDIIESGRNPLENARIKAGAYYKILGKPVFSLDSGLYIDQLPDELQPGLMIRRVGKKRLNDDEMVEYYSDLARQHGGYLTARYVNGICLIMDKNRIYEYMGDDIASKKFLICSVPHKKRVEGFPIDCLSVDIDTKRYYYDLYDSITEKEKPLRPDNGFNAFFARIMADYAE